MNRKEFFKTTGRLLILGGMLTSAGYLVVNKKVSATCTVSPTCSNCGKVSNCISPEVKEKRGEIGTLKEFNNNSRPDNSGRVIGKVRTEP